MTPFKCLLLITGGRKYADRERVYTILDTLRTQHGVDCLLNGGQDGADALGRAWAEERGVVCLTEPADWNRYGKAAGPIRNQKMIDMLPDLVVAFPGGKGTRDCVKRAWNAYPARRMTIVEVPE